MKTLRIARNLALGTMISIAAATTVSAQQGSGGGQGRGHGRGEGRGEPTEEQMTERVDRLKLLLELTPDQEAKVKALAEKHAKEAEADRTKIREERLKRREAHQAEIKAILTAEQYAKFEALQEEHGRGKGNGQGKSVKK